MVRGGHKLPDEIIYDRGDKGRREINGVQILTPDTHQKTDTIDTKQQKRKRFRS